MKGIMAKYIDIKYLPCAFWTCPGISVRVRLGWWQAAFVVGLPDVINKIIKGKK
jgi:hypothetical protein